MIKRLLFAAKKHAVALVLFALSLFVIVPLWMMVTGSFMSGGELLDNLGPVLYDAGGLVGWPVLPRYPTLQPMVELLLDSPEFFVMFWNTCYLVFPILAGQMLIAVPAAWAFARYSFRGKKLLFTLYIVLMLMPFQVTMVSSFLVLDKLSLLNTRAAVILPAIFSTFPVFIMVKFFASIPKTLIEAAELDGGERVASVPAHRASDGHPGDHVGARAGFFGVLERHRAAADVFAGQGALAAVAVLAGHRRGEGGRFAHRLARDDGACAAYFLIGTKTPRTGVSALRGSRSRFMMELVKRIRETIADGRRQTRPEPRRA